MNMCTKSIMASAIIWASLACEATVFPASQAFAQSDPATATGKSLLDLPELVARVKPSVVTILTYDSAACVHRSIAPLQLRSIRQDTDSEVGQARPRFAGDNSFQRCWPPPAPTLRVCLSWGA